MTDRSADEKIADEMFQQIDPYEPSPVLWKGIQDYIDKIMKDSECDYLNIQTRLVTHDTTPSILETFEPPFFAHFPLVKAALVIGFSMKKHLNDPEPVLKGAILLLDDKRKAFAFVPAQPD
jgi:hypothetical protein